MKDRHKVTKLDWMWRSIVEQRIHQTAWQRGINTICHIHSKRNQERRRKKWRMSDYLFRRRQGRHFFNRVRVRVGKRLQEVQERKNLGEMNRRRKDCRGGREMELQRDYKRQLILGGWWMLWLNLNWMTRGSAFFPYFNCFFLEYGSQVWRDIFLILTNYMDLVIWWISRFFFKMIVFFKWI